MPWKEVGLPFVTVLGHTLILNSLAYHEMRLILAAVLWHFDIDLVDKEEVWTNQKNYELWEKKPLFVNLTPATRDKA